MGLLDDRPFAPKSLADLLSGPRWLIDESLPQSAAAMLVRSGHDAVAVCGRPEMEGMADPLLLQLAREQGRVLVTADKDYGSLVFRDRMPAPAGVVTIRDSERAEDVAGLLMWLLLEQPVVGHFLSIKRGRGHGQVLPSDRDRVAKLEEIRRHRPRPIRPFAIPERYVRAA